MWSAMCGIEPALPGYQILLLHHFQDVYDNSRPIFSFLPVLWRHLACKFPIVTVTRCCEIYFVR